MTSALMGVGIRGNRTKAWESKRVIANLPFIHAQNHMACTTDRAATIRTNASSNSDPLTPSVVLRAFCHVFHAVSLIVGQDKDNVNHPDDHCI